MAFIQSSVHHEEWVHDPNFENLSVDMDVGSSTDFSSTSRLFKSREPPTAQHWEEIRPIFTQMYSVENKELKAVMRILESERGFYATLGFHRLPLPPARLMTWQKKNVQQANQ